MSLDPESGDLWAEVQALRERVATLERSDRAIATSVREPGRIRFIDADGITRLSIGQLTAADGTDMGIGLLVQRADGTDALTVLTTEATLNHADGTDAVAVTGGQVQLVDNTDNVGLLVSETERSIRFVGNETVAGVHVGSDTVILRNAAGGNAVGVTSSGQIQLIDANSVIGLLVSDTVRRVIDADGDIGLHVDGLTRSLRYPGSDTVQAVYVSGTDARLIAPDGTTVLLVDSANRLQVTVEDSTGADQAGQVTAGAADSGGVGYRLLRIPN